MAERGGIGVGVGLEVVVLIAAAAWVLWQVLTGASSAPGPAVVLAAFALLAALMLGAAARSVLRGGSGPARAVVVTWQLVQAGSAGTIIGAGGSRASALVGAWVAVALALGVVLSTVLDARRTARPPRQDD